MACTPHAARDFVAHLVSGNMMYLPIFSRLDEECGVIDMTAQNNHVEAARALIRQHEIIMLKLRGR